MEWGLQGTNRRQEPHFFNFNFVIFSNMLLLPELGGGGGGSLTVPGMFKYRQSSGAAVAWTVYGYKADKACR